MTVISRVNFRRRSEKNMVHLMTQAERARSIAAQCSSSLVADILEAHAKLCERNAARMAARGPRRQK
jgi:hypothetical protein